MNESGWQRIHKSVRLISFPFKAFVVVAWPFYWVTSATTVAILDNGTAARHKFVVLPAVWSTGDSIVVLYGIAALALLLCWGVQSALPIDTQPERTRVRRFFLAALFVSFYGFFVYCNHVLA